MNGSVKVTLADVDRFDSFEHIIVDIKMHACKEIITVSTGKWKQDVVIADSTSTAMVTVWEEK